jgi:cholesterol transport system auxiliary component
MTGRLAYQSALLTLLFAGALWLTGCSLLGTGDKPSLYRFGNLPEAPAAPPAPAMAKPALITFNGVAFPAESRGDRIVTVRGADVAYVAEARWVAPAPELFNTALRRQFGQSVDTVRLVRPGEAPRADFVLTVEVRRFEAAYLSGVAPEVIVEADVTLMRWTDRTIVGEWTVASRKPAAENRVSAIVAAYDEAAADVIGRIGQSVTTFLATPLHPVS